MAARSASDILLCARRLPTTSMPDIRATFAGRNVVMTGCAGFIGKILIEKVLRSLPDSGKIFLIVRGKGTLRVPRVPRS